MGKLYSTPVGLSAIKITKIALSKVIAQICDSAIKTALRREITAKNGD